MPGGRPHETEDREMNEHLDDQPETYDVQATQDKWLPVWDEMQPFRADDDSPREKRYALTMFPYPSGDLHMGHAEVTALHDVLARYWWPQGYEVMNPIGWDSFGLPAENAAIQRDEHPATYTYANIETQAASFRKYAVSFDWSRRLHTSDPEYYRWTQWLFLKLRERGLAYRKSSPVNWCPNDQTVLANEQVVDGFCERCGAEVTKRELTQWYFKVTDYAQRLLDDMEDLDWPERVLTLQRNWIGRSEGAHVDFDVATDGGGSRVVSVYTTRPDTLFGATFMVVAADAKLAADIVSDEQRPTYEDYLNETRKSSDIDRMATDRPKTGVFLGAYAVNPVNGQSVPVHAADYVLADYGTGAIMAVPGQDQRDWDFAKAYDLPIIRTVQPSDDHDLDTAFTGQGPAINSSNDELSLDGLGVADAKERITAWLQEKGLGEPTVTYKLRDWLFSRQRYWGEPFPVVFDEDGVAHGVPDSMLPVELPEVPDYSPKTSDPDDASSEPEPPPSRVDEWVHF